MKRETLKALGLDDSVIDQIMAENGKDIEKYKTDAESAKTNNEQLLAQLDEANKTIDGFKAMDIDGIKKGADEYKSKFEQAQKDFDAKLSKMSYDSAAEKYVDSLKPKDTLSKKAVLAEFQAKGFKLDGENFVGAKEWAEQFQKDNAAHFGDAGTSEPAIFSGKIGASGAALNTDGFLSAARKAAGLSDGASQDAAKT